MEVNIVPNNIFKLSNAIPITRIFFSDMHHSIKAKRARASQVKHKSTITLYNKLSDMVGNLAELVEIQELTDTVILQVCNNVIKHQKRMFCCMK